jgi:GMP synthase (glutamine-hydrolysing)
MILLISTCAEELHELEFVKPIEDILRKSKIPYSTKHYKNISESDLKKADKVIICGTSLQDNEFLKDLKKFEWIKNFEEPLFGICAGAHVIGIILGYKIKKKKEIGLKKLNLRKEFLGVKSEMQVYHLHGLQVLPETFKHPKKEIYATLFHPEVRNKEIISNFVTPKCF